MMHSTEVKADDGAVFRRNANGVYFQVDDDSVIAGWAVRRFAYLHAVFAALRRFVHLMRSGAGRRCKKRSNKNFENVKNVKRDKYKKNVCKRNKKRCLFLVQLNSTPDTQEIVFKAVTQCVKHSE